jgi:methylated-DNA-[protein]-cysteine S-methyltransferase
MNRYASAILHTQTYETPCGNLLLASCEEKLCLCDWYNGTVRDSIDRRLHKFIPQLYYATEPSDITREAARQLDEYFACKRQEFTLPLCLIGTPFQLQVWEQLQQIPYGCTRSYKEIATLTGNPNAFRAVAAANHSNALSIIIPCHRVIGSDSSLTGYAGGLDAKRMLLALEATD